MLRVALACLLAMPAVAAADPAPAGWPAAGHCVEAADGKRPCALRIKPADAAAIRAAMLAWLTPARVNAEGALHRARQLAELPITEDRIGGYHLVTVRHVGGHDELQLTGSVWRSHRGFKAVLRPGRAGWTVVGITTFSRHPRRR